MYKLLVSIRQLLYLTLIVVVMYALSMLIGYLVYLFSQYRPEVSINSQPYDYPSAENLAFTIAKLANCKDIEPIRKYSTGANFSCSKDKFSSFNISIFYNQQVKEKYMKELSTTKDWSTFKAGSFYIILENINSEHRNVPEDYTDFSGELITPLKIRQ